MPLFPIVPSARGSVHRPVGLAGRRPARSAGLGGGGSGIEPEPHRCGNAQPAANRIAGFLPAVHGRPGGSTRLDRPPDRVLNTWLFVPLGFFAGFAVRRVWVLVLAFCVPLFVEGIQRYAQVLGRRCQFQDLVDNTWGLILGALVGSWWPRRPADGQRSPCEPVTGAAACEPHRKCRTPRSTMEPHHQQRGTMQNPSTSDWHLGRTLHKTSLRAAQESAMDQIVAIAAGS